MTVTIHIGDCRDVMRALPEKSVHTCISSPPYFGLRDYGVDGQIGLEAIPDCLGWATGERCGACFVCVLVDVYQEVRRVLRDDGTCWVNLGDSYAATRGSQPPDLGSNSTLSGAARAGNGKGRRVPSMFKPKDLMGMPWRVALALQADGWYLRQDIIWNKPNPMPESAKDRCTKAHEYLFLLSKQPRYYYDGDAIRTPFSGETKAQSFATMQYKKRDRYKKPDGWDTGKGGHGTIHRAGREKGDTAADDYIPPNGANKRSVWTVATQPYSEAHFATFPTTLIEPCVLAGSPSGGVVLDPFGGSGTTGVVAEALGRDSILIELKPAYAALAKRRTQQGGISFPAEATS